MKLVVFDLDGVLLTSSFEKEKEHCFLSLSDCNKIQSGIILLNEIKSIMNNSTNIHCCILTTRHPLLNLEIYHEFKIPVFTRDFCYSKSEMIDANKNTENTNRFLQEMVDFKTRYLNFFADRYDQVIFIDDMLNLFDTSKLAKNIFVYLPENQKEIIHSIKDNTEKKEDTEAGLKDFNEKMKEVDFLRKQVKELRKQIKMKLGEAGNIFAKVVKPVKIVPSEIEKRH